MQRFTIIPENWTLAESLPFINEDFATLLTNNSGTAFPQINIKNGMLCYREDLKKLYILLDEAYIVWYMIIDFTKIPVMKDYVDSIRIPIERIDGLFKEGKPYKIKLELVETGELNGQIVALNIKNKIATKLIDTGTDSNQIVQLDNNAKIAIKNIPHGIRADDLVKLNGDAKIPDSVIPNDVAKFNVQGRLVFPNGNQLVVE